MPQLKLILSTLLACAAVPVSAQTVTAVCREPVGRMMGVNGTVFGKGEALDEKDAMSGGQFTILWDGSKTARVISQGSGGGEPLSDTAAVVFQSDEQVSLLVTYQSAVWLYSLYSKPKILLITSHNNGPSIDQGGAINKSLKAGCEISLVRR